MVRFREFYLSTLSETALSKAELLKYDYRVPLFIDKIKNNEPFVTNDNKEIYLDNSQQNIDALYSIINGEKSSFISNGEKISLSKLKKTPDFGGGKGSGGGADQTKLTESAQCAYNAVVYKHGELEDGGQFLSLVDGCKDLFDVDETLDNIKKNMNEKWIKSSVSISNLILKKFPGKYISHRGSKLVDVIESTFNKINSKEGKPLKNINKWNPSDIWLVKPGFNINDIKKCTNFIELNEFINRAYNKRELIGISLKKTTTDSIPYSVYNEPGTELGIQYTHFKVSSDKGTQEIFEDAIDIYVHFTYKGEEAKIQFRAFNGTKGWQGEVKGSEANGGKIGGGIVSSFVGNNLTKSSDITKMSIKRDEKFMKKFYKYYLESYTSKISYEEFLEKSKSASDSYIYSKYSGLEFLYYLNKSNNINRVMSNIIGYALSATDLSSVFVKIGK